MAKFLRYDGGLMDHEDIPAKARNDSNRPLRAKDVPPSERRYFEMDPVVLRGVSYPKGEAVQLAEGSEGDAVLKKARALGCFSVSDEAPADPDPQPAGDADESAKPAPKRRGRPRKTVTE